MRQLISISRPVIRHLLIVAGIIALCPHTCFADDLDLQLRKFVVQAKGPVAPSTVAALAQTAKPTTLDQAHYPDAPKFSAQEVIKVLCGSYQSTYWSETLRSNAQLKLFLDKPLGELVYKIQWPACVYVAKRVDPPFHYAVKTGESAADIFKGLTGSAGSRSEIDRFFQKSDVKNIASIKPGQVLTFAQYTRPTVVQIDSQSTAAVTAEPTALKFTNAADVLPVVAPPPPPPPSAPATDARPHFQIAAGRISAAVTDGYQPPEECTSDKPTVPFDPVELKNAYTYSLKEAVNDLNIGQYPAQVTIADNGFFGARLVGNKPVFGTPFPARFFGTARQYSDGQIGPVVKDGKQIIYPLNYSNNLTSADIVSGHGTHVTGLVLGGPIFETYTSLFDSAAGQPWLHLLIINVGRGEETLTPDSEQQLITMIRMLDSRIVNLSIEYKNNPFGNIRNTFTDMVTGAHSANNLYVVAAGNDSEPDVGNPGYYPAALGGSAQPNVISVAAHRNDGSLANFGNRGPTTVDIAAPGCNVSSWINELNVPYQVSGTSQAAAIVTFSASLIRSLGTFSPAQIKQRIFVSGDLLSNGHFSTQSSYVGELNPDPAEIMSRSKLNPVKALFVYDDYVRYRLPGDTADSEVIGEVDQVPVITCEGVAADSSDGKDTWAFKTDGYPNAGWLYRGRTTATLNRPCQAKVSSDQPLHIKLHAKLDAAGNLSAANPGDTMTIAPDAVREFVAAANLQTQ